LTRSCRRRRGKRACKLWFSSLLKRREEKLWFFFSAQEKRGKALDFLLYSREERKSLQALPNNVESVCVNEKKTQVEH